MNFQYSYIRCTGGSVVEMLRVVGEEDRAGAVAEADRWVPLTISWEPSPPGLQLHLSVTGENGGSIKIQVSRETGALTRLAVIGQPPPADRDVPHPPAEGSVYASPVVDTSAWGSSLPIPEKTTIDIVDATADLGFARRDNRVLVTFGRDKPVRYIVCGAVAVGVAADDNVVEIVADVVDLHHDWTEIMAAKPSR